MLSSLMLVLLTQAIACTPGETSLVCNCKQGMVSACMTLVGEDAWKAAQVLDAVEEELEALEQAAPMAGEEGQKKKKQKQQLQAAAESLSQSLGSSEPPHCTGRSRDFINHQDWHRDVDDEVIDWLDDYPKATSKEFMDKLREIHGRPEMKARFPHGF